MGAKKFQSDFMHNLEIEVTYLAKYIPEDVKSSPRKLLIDIYFPENLKQPRLRLRQKGEKYELTKKVPTSEGDASSHTEMTIELTEDEFKALEKAGGKRVSKRRYLYTYKGKEAEIDIFEEELKGFVLVEFEFKSRDEMEKFGLPDFCLADVTQEDFVAGGILAGKSYEDISSDLSRYGYKKL